MRYNIYRNNTLLTSINPDDSSFLLQRKEEGTLVQLEFSTDTYVDLQIGDYIYKGETRQLYTLFNKPTIHTSPNQHRYICVFEGSIARMKHTTCLLLTESEGKVYNDYTFSLTGNARTFLLFLVENLNRNEGDFSAGEWEDTETVTIQFNNWTVYEAIEEIASQLEISWYVTPEGAINLKEKVNEIPYLFTIGNLSGIVSLSITRVVSEEISTVVYGFGGSQNMPPRRSDGITYDSVNLADNRLFFGTDSRLEKNVGLYGIREKVVEFPDIYPSFTGEVGQVIDTFSFLDNSIDFDINEQLAAGIPPKVTFLSGMLNGMTFNISYDSNQIALEPLEEQGTTYPNETIGFHKDDTYTITDIIMPQSYVEAAQIRLQEHTQEWIDNNSKPYDVYEALLDEQYMRMYDIRLELGDTIRIVSEEFGIDAMFEIKELRSNINNPYKVTLKFGDKLPIPLVNGIRNSTFTNRQNVYNISRTMVSTSEVTNIIGGETPTWQQL
jgi:hypothetical protein